MKIDTKIDKDVKIIGEVISTTEFKINDKALGMMFKGFSDNLYSDKFGSIVRELTSNCIDSHIEANIKLPIKIRITELDALLNDSIYIEFIDYGIGISPDRMANIYSCYFTSSKNDTNKQIGGWGIGAKSPLAYTNIFYLTTICNNTKYEYVIHRGEKAPIIELVFKAHTKKSNGTVVKIPIKNSTDENKFKEAIKYQLQYFDNIIYENCGENKFTIYEGKNFLYRDSNESYKRIHISIGKIKYPLDTNLISVDYDLKTTPVALKFDIGDLNVTMSRENIEYTEKTIEAIKNKLVLVEQELISIYTKQINDTNDLEEYLQLNKNNLYLSKDVILYSTLFDITNKNFKPFIEIGVKPHICDIFNDYTITHRIIDGKIKKISNCNVHDIIFNTTTTIFYTIKENYNKRKIIYIDETETKPIYFISKCPNYTTIKDNLFSLKEQKLLTKEEQELRSSQYREYIDKFIKSKTKEYDNIVIPEVWLKNYLTNLKNNNTNNISKNNITIKEVCKKDSYTSNYTANYPEFEFRRNSYSTSTIYKILKSNKLIVYGDNNNSQDLLSLAEILNVFKNDIEKYNFKDLNTISVIKISKPNIKIFEKFENTVHVKDFHKKHWKIITKIETMFDIQKQRTNLKDLKNIFCNVNCKISNIITRLLRFYDYYSRNYVNSLYSEDSKLLWKIYKKHIAYYNYKIKPRYYIKNKEYQVIEDLNLFKDWFKNNMLFLFIKDRTEINIEEYKMNTTKAVKKLIETFKNKLHYE